MMWIELFFAFVIALLLSFLFVAGLGWRRPGGAGGALALFFLLVFLFTWAGGVWVGPYGPALWGVPWLTFLIVGLFVALLITAVAPPPPRRVRLATGPEDDPRVAEAATFNAFFWILLLGSIVLLLFAYV